MKRAIKFISLITLCLAVFLPLTSCEDSYPPPGVNPGEGGYYPDVDSDLIGSWQLAYVNGRPVDGYNTNYLDFYGNGTGDYYYYEMGEEYALGFDFWCEYDYGGQYLYINYYDGTRAEMSYWFNSSYDVLYLQWQSGGQLITYTYYYIYDSYRAPEKSVGRADVSAEWIVSRPGAVE